MKKTDWIFPTCERVVSQKPRCGTSALRFVCLTVFVLAPWVASPSLTQTATPEISALHTYADSEDGFLVVIAETIHPQDVKIGAYVECNLNTGEVNAGFSFGTFRRGKPVQAAVRHANGDTHRFGAVVRYAGKRLPQPEVHWRLGASHRNSGLLAQCAHQ